jgi:hypothetical protein
MNSSSPRARRRLGHGAAAALLLLFVLLLFAPLLFTNRVLATGDILDYVYPHRSYAAEALRNGRIPFWNPYLFMGVPFLANPQSAVLYPLHWPLSWLPVTAQVYWSAALHLWILGVGGYALQRRWGNGWPAGLVTGLLLAGSGLLGGMLGHLNQINGAAWLPWVLLGVEASRLASGWRPALLGAAAIALATTLMLLAGHTQTLYIVLFGCGLWAALPLLLWSWRRLRRKDPLVAQDSWAGALRPLAMLAAGVATGTLMAMPQLLPVLELSGLGLRSGGLAWLDATSFSLKPLQLPFTLLPTYGLVSLEAIFQTPAYTEFIAYIGVAGLALAALGIWKGSGPARLCGVLLLAGGLVLAAGRWSPLYLALFQVAPGFDLFRAPARWLLLYTMGAALLAGGGVQWLLGRRRGRRWLPLLALLIAGELLVAAQALPHAHPTAPQAVTDLRTAPAHLLTDPLRNTLGSAAAGRFLGMSTITYDPGDMADSRRIFLEREPPQLDERTFRDLIIAQKVQELLVPNLPLLWRIPAVDGYDGGVLPLQRFLRLAEALVAPAPLVPDGRLREQIRTVPASGRLALLNADYLITDKVKDLWFEGIYYDLQIGARLAAGAQPVATTFAPSPFSATAIDLIGAVTGTLPAGLVSAGTVTITGVGGDANAALVMTTTFPLMAGSALGAQWGAAQLDAPVTSDGPTVALRDVEAGVQWYRARLQLSAPLTVDAVTVASLLPADNVLQLQAITLFDERTGMFLSLLPSDRGRFERVHSGDVKIYRNVDSLPRAYLVHQAVTVSNTQAAAAALLGGDLIPGVNAVVELPPEADPLALDSSTGDPAQDQVEIIHYAAEEIVLRTMAGSSALLVLSDSYYPGWTATVDGRPATILPANVAFRGVVLPPGAHEVRFAYRPTGWETGLWLGGGGLLVWLGLVVAGFWQIGLHKDGSRAV